MSSALELESSADQFWWIKLHYSFNRQVHSSVYPWRVTYRGGGGDYSREAIILNIFVKEARLLEGGD